MFDATLPPLLSSLAMALGTPDETPTRTGNRHGGLAEAPYNVYPTARRLRRDHLRQRASVGCARRDRSVDPSSRWTSASRRARRASRTSRRSTRQSQLGRRDAHARGGGRRASAERASRSHRFATCARSSRIPISRRAACFAISSDPEHGPVRVFSSPIRYDGREPVAPAPAARARRAHRRGPARMAGRPRPCSSAMTGVRRCSRAWQPLDAEHVAKVGGHMGVYELSSPTGRSSSSASPAVGRCSACAASSRSQLESNRDREALSFGLEITTTYLSRYKELLMVHVADHGSVPPRTRRPRTSGA